MGIQGIQYYDLPKAILELQQRLDNCELQEKAQKILGEECPFPKGRGVIFRHLADARLETVEFEKRCASYGLLPLIGTYKKDRFVTCNPSKVRLVRIRVFQGCGKRGGVKEKNYNLIPKNEWRNLEGCSLETIRVNGSGVLLRDVHREMREEVGLKANVVDASSWLSSQGDGAVNYYKSLMLFAATSGILFESFHSPGFGTNLDFFNRRVVQPAIKWVEENGFPPPLIVYHPPVPREKEYFLLNYYPEEVETVLLRYLT